MHTHIKRGFLFEPVNRSVHQQPCNLSLEAFAVCKPAWRAAQKCAPESLATQPVARATVNSFGDCAAAHACFPSNGQIKTNQRKGLASYLQTKPRHRCNNDCNCAHHHTLRLWFESPIFSVHWRIDGDSKRDGILCPSNPPPTPLAGNSTPQSPPAAECRALAEPRAGAPHTPSRSQTRCYFFGTRAIQLD